MSPLLFPVHKWDCTAWTADPWWQHHLASHEQLSLPCPTYCQCSLHPCWAALRFWAQVPILTGRGMGMAHQPLEPEQCKGCKAGTGRKPQQSQVRTVFGTDRSWQGGSSCFGYLNKKKKVWMLSKRKPQNTAVTENLKTQLPLFAPPSCTKNREFKYISNPL